MLLRKSKILAKLEISCFRQSLGMRKQRNSCWRNNVGLWKPFLKSAVPKWLMIFPKMSHVWRKVWQSLKHSFTICLIISVELPQDCGITRAGSNRVVNGLPSKLHAWPWMAALGYKNSSTGEIVYRWRATLFTGRHVLTVCCVQVWSNPGHC